MENVWIVISTVVSVAICAAVLVCASSGLCDVCSVPVWLVLHSSFSQPKADVTGTMGSGRLPWRPTGGRLKVSPPRGAQQMEAEVIICCSAHLLTPHTPMPPPLSLSLRQRTAKMLQISYCVIGIKCKNIVKCFTSCKHIKHLNLFVLLTIKSHYHAPLSGL